MKLICCPCDAVHTSLSTLPILRTKEGGQLIGKGSLGRGDRILGCCAYKRLVFAPPAISSFRFHSLVLALTIPAGRGAVPFPSAYPADLRDKQVAAAPLSSQLHVHFFTFSHI